MTTEVSTGSEMVSQLIGAPVRSVFPDATLHDAADAMVASSVGALVVREDRGSAVGIVSERDLVGALADRRNPATTRARDIASTTLVWCDVEATLAEVAEEMMDAYVRHVLVERDGRLVGIVSSRDLLGAYASADVGLE
jgi:CBS domain-containing protein